MSQLFVSSFGTGKVHLFDTNTNTVSDYTDNLGSPMGLALDVEDNLYVACFGPIITVTDPVTGRRYQARSRNQGNVYRIAPDGAKVTFVAGIDNPTGLAFGPDEKLYISCYGSGDIGTGSVLRLDGSLVTTIATGLTGPAGIAFDDFGNLLVTNYGSDNSIDIYKVSPAGEVSSAVSSPLLFTPFGVVRDGDSIFSVNQQRGTIVVKKGAAAPVMWLSHPLLKGVFDLKQSGSTFFATNQDRSTVLKIDRTPLGAATTPIVLTSAIQYPSGLAVKP